jgi:hypothetical protein
MMMEMMMTPRMMTLMKTMLTKRIMTKTITKMKIMKVFQYKRSGAWGPCCMFPPTPWAQKRVGVLQIHQDGTPKWPS